MIKSDKKLKELSGILDKKNPILITEAILSLRDEEPFEGAIGLLVSYYNETDDFSVRKAIEGFMNDLKDLSARPEVITEIKKPWKASTRKMLVSSCWQSGMNYSDYLTDLVKIFMDGDYSIAFECLTVIEGSAHNSLRRKKDEIIRIVENNPVSIDEKTALTLELIAILEK
jgi:predicted DNA-binding protein